jgi:hypothetical protein
MTRSEILADVIRAMQNAEEMGGPVGVEYMALMMSIESEARTRLRNFIKASGSESLRSYFSDLKTVEPEHSANMQAVLTVELRRRNAEGKS